MRSATRLSEFDTVVSLVDVEAQVPGEDGTRTIPAGTLGAIVLLHENDGFLAAYEIEFPLGGGAGALAAVPADKVKPAP